MEAIINKEARKNTKECTESRDTEKSAEDAMLAITDITIEEVSIDGICGVY